MPIEGMQHYSNQAYGNKQVKQNVTVPKEIEMPGIAKDVSMGGLSTVVAAGLAEIKRNLEKKLTRAQKKLSQGLLSALGIEGDEGEESAGGMETIKKGIKEIFMNLQRKLNGDD